MYLYLIYREITQNIFVILIKFNKSNGSLFSWQYKLYSLRYIFLPNFNVIVEIKIHE